MVCISGADTCAAMYFNAHQYTMMPLPKPRADLPISGQLTFFPCQICAAWRNPCASANPDRRVNPIIILSTFTWAIMPHIPSWQVPYKYRHSLADPVVLLLWHGDTS